MEIEIIKRKQQNTSQRAKVAAMNVHGMDDVSN